MTLPRFNDRAPLGRANDNGLHFIFKVTTQRPRTLATATDQDAKLVIKPPDASSENAGHAGGRDLRQAPESIVAAAVTYTRRGWSVIPVNDRKRPAIARWKPAQTAAEKPDRVPQLFSRSKRAVGVGIVLGKVSGDLYVRDFDKAGAYEAWAATYPALARTLPTVQTSRGFHVYARWPGGKTRTMSDGELRGDGTYVVAPPSPHPSGCFYVWRVPLTEGPVPLIDPVVAGLAQSAESPSICATESTELQRHGDTEAIKELGASLISRDDVRNAMMRTIPKQRGKRNDAVFRLARALKGLSGIAETKTSNLRPVVKTWHQMALENIGTKDFATTWGDFVHAWKNVHTPEGTDTLALAMAAAAAAASPAWAADYGAGAQILASLCRELQRRAGVGKTWFLSCGKAADCVGVDKGTASRWLKAFVADGSLLEVTKGSKTTGRATRFLYIANDLDQVAQTTYEQKVDRCHQATHRVRSCHGTANESHNDGGEGERSNALRNR